MNGIEMGRETLKYVGKTAKEISGIGPAQRAYKHRRMLLEKDMNKVLFVRSLNAAIVNGMERIVSPYSQRAHEDSGYKVSDIRKIGIDTIVNSAIIALGFFGYDRQNVLIAKLGYNTLVQIAPDVARLAKGKIFQRARAK